MAAFIYTALRELAPGHIAGQAYQFDLRLQDLTFEKYVEKEVQKTLSGRVGALRSASGINYSLTSEPIKLDAMANIFEFMASCDSNELFQFDPYGTLSVPRAPVLGYLDTDAFGFNRFSRLGQGGHNDFITFSLKIKTVSP